MNKIILFSVLIMSLFSFSCSDDIINNNVGEGLNFFLLKDSTITTNEIMNVNLNELTLAEKPILSYKDLVNYNWSNHSFEIGSTKANEIKNYCLNNISVRGIPFIVTVDKERIYLGSFWASYSSLAPVFPHIEATYIPNQTPTILIIGRSWNEMEQDSRNDQRIYNSLKKFGLLVFN
jgi:hypothetical protein